MKILVYIECKEGQPVPGSLEALTPARELGEVAALVVGTTEEAQRAAAYGESVSLIQDDSGNPDVVLEAVTYAAKSTGADAVFFAGTQLGKDLAPRLAARLDTGCVTDVTAIEASEDGSLLYTRPAYGGTILELLRNEGKVQVATLRSGSWPKPERRAEAPVEELPFQSRETVKAKVLETVKELAEAVDLEGADVIVAGGRGMGDAEHFKLVEELAGVLGGVVGASRPAIEEGWIPRSHQIGQSGKIVAPKLYIACGISGAMQHISGAMGAKYIVAINKDPDASIFSVADLGIVGDAKEILPLFIDELRKRKA